ncbi:MAG: Rrf2 family transcriptional regulator [Pseudomonadota bacterium]|nr:Rrf2 family transcriptional regulator [Pseudomonadota bacterium]
MLGLAYHGGKKPISLHDIAGRQSISMSCLEQLFARWRKASIVKGVRGAVTGWDRTVSSPASLTP